jgi:renalase
LIDVAVVGAGWSGLTAASRLAASGHSVIVLEKARGPGGRSATRRQEGFSFDHGAQYLTARSQAFARQVEQWAASGLLQPWRPRIRVLGPKPANDRETPAERWVGVPGMNSVPHRLAEGLDCRWGWRVANVEWANDHWQLGGESGGVLTARSLLLTAPPAQCLELLGTSHALAAELGAVEVQPCWALMLGFEDVPDVNFDAAFVNDGPLSWLARNDSKSGRGGGPAWIAHARAEWSAQHLEDGADLVRRQLQDALVEIDAGFGRGLQLAVAHRWRYAQAVRMPQGPVLAKDSERLVIAGDWCAGGRIEGAWISGVAAARQLQSLL